MVIQCINWQLGWIEKLKPSDQINQEKESKGQSVCHRECFREAEAAVVKFMTDNRTGSYHYQIAFKRLESLQLYVRVHFKRRNIHPNIKAVNCMWQWIRALFFKQWNWNVIESEWSMKKELTCKTLQEESCVMTVLKMYHFYIYVLRFIRNWDPVCKYLIK